MRGSEAAAQRFKLRCEHALASQLEVGEWVIVGTVIQTGSLATFVTLGLSGIAVGWVYLLLLFPRLGGGSLLVGTITFAITTWALWVAAVRLGLKPRQLVLTDHRLLLCEFPMWFPFVLRPTDKVVGQESRQVVRVEKVSESRNAVRFALITPSDRLAARLVADGPSSLHDQFDAVADWADDDRSPPGT